MVHRASSRTGLLLTGCLLLSAPSADAAARWQAIGVEGEPSPAGRAYGELLLASQIGDDGAVAFRDVSADPVPDPPTYTIWRWSEGEGATTLATILVDAGNDGWRVPDLVANRSGDLAWRDGRLPSLVACGDDAMSTQARERLVLLPRGGVPSLLVETGTPAPGDPEATWARLLRPAFGIPPPISFFGPTWLLGPDGDLSFRAELAADPCFVDDGMTELTRALFAPDLAGAAARIAQDGEPLPGATQGETIRLEDLSLATDGLGVWFALVGFDSPGENALLRWDAQGGALDTVVRTDEPSPWLDGAWLESIGEPRASPGGVVALRGVRDQSEPFPLAGRNGIWVGDAGGLAEEVILAGPVPGAAPGSAFVSWPFAYGPLHVNDTGELAFAAVFTPVPGADPKLGIFGPGPGGTPTLRLAVDDPAPGFDGLSIVTLVAEHLAPTGDVLAFALLDDQPLPHASGAWILLPRGAAPRLLLSDPKEIEVAPGDVRSLPVAEFAHDEALLHFAARFEGDLGPDVLAVYRVPEPGALLAGSSAFAAVGLRGARRARIRPIRNGCAPRSR